MRSVCPSGRGKMYERATLRAVHADADRDANPHPKRHPQPDHHEDSDRHTDNPQPDIHAHRHALPYRHGESDLHTDPARHPDRNPHTSGE